MDAETKDKHRKDFKKDHPLVRENRLLQIRLNLAQAFIGLWRRAYDALLVHGVNVRALPEFDETAKLDAAIEGGIEHGQEGVMRYLETVEGGLKAAIRRKQFGRIK
jgi:hypothetical protein